MVADEMGSAWCDHGGVEVMHCTEVERTRCGYGCVEVSRLWSRTWTEHLGKGRHGVVVLTIIQVLYIMGSETLIEVILAILLPPVGVFLRFGCAVEFWICLVLTLLGYIPGIIYALYVLVG
ncbi:hypothetical protein F8388_026883 [Cannabis sativa]|uniref:Uncharacterized protein n=1 Tax=Cannabis sativa TaxID=3483 RepID=A0A7J6H1R6_CANSA|nr:hypothetical protein F8388_026883 [Cannabis sativa]